MPSLNAGPGSKDDPDSVNENRRRIAASFGVAADRLVGVHQVHSPQAVRVHGPWRGPRPEADALVTTDPGIVLRDSHRRLRSHSSLRRRRRCHWRSACGLEEGAHYGVIDQVIETMEAAGRPSHARIVAADRPVHSSSQLRGRA